MTTLQRPEVETPPPQPPGRLARRRWRRPRGLAGLPLLLLVGFLILVPAGFVLLTAFNDGIPRPGNFAINPTLEHLAVFAEPGVLEATFNSLLIGVSATLLALLIGGVLAFVTARTDIPAKGFVFLIGLMPLFLPSYVGALAWSMLASPGAGLLNIGLRDLGIGATLDIYSLGGVVGVLGMFYAPYAFLLLHSSMSMMNPDLEDAAGVHGGSTWRMLSNVTLPLALPAVLGSALLVFTHVFENFPVSQVLATPGQIDTLPTFIYRLMNASPSRGNESAVLAVVLVIVVLLVTLGQRRILARRSFTTVSGKGMKARRISLGRWRLPLFGFALLYLLLSIVLPLAALVLTAVRTSPYMTSFADLAQPGAIDFGAFGQILSSGVFLGATTNSVLVAVSAAAIGTVLAFLVGYTVYRTRARGRGLLEGVSMVPLAIPAIVLGMGLLWTWLLMPVPLYGTLGVLVIAFVAVQMPQGLRGIAASIQATERDLEDNAVLHGARRSRAIIAITLPLMRVSIASTFLILLMLSMRELTVPLFLYTSDTQILSIAIFDQFENGGALQEAAAMSVIYCLIMLVLSYLPRRLGGQLSS